MKPFFYNFNAKFINMKKSILFIVILTGLFAIQSCEYEWIEPETGDLVLQNHRGLTPTFVTDGHRHAAGTDLVDLVMSGGSIYMGGSDLEAVLTAEQRREGLKSLYVVPLGHEQRVIGCVNLASHEREGINRTVRESLESLTAHMGSVLERLQSQDALRRSEERFLDIAAYVLNIR